MPLVLSIASTGAASRLGGSPGHRGGGWRGQCTICRDWTDKIEDSSQVCTTSLDITHLLPSYAQSIRVLPSSICGQSYELVLLMKGMEEKLSLPASVQ